MASIARRRPAPLTRERIAEAAIALFGERGVERTTMKDVASALGVTEPALYRHCESKEDLFRRAFLEAYADLARDVSEIKRAQTTFSAQVTALVGLCARVFDENNPLFIFLLVDQHRHLGDAPSGADRNPVAALREIFAQAMALGAAPSGNPDLAVAVALGMVVQTAIFVHYGRLPGPMSSYVETLAQRICAATAAG